MNRQQAEGWSRREFLEWLTLVGAAGLLGLRPERVSAEPPPETTTLRLVAAPPSLCIAPQYVAEELLRGEGFTDVQHVKMEAGRVSMDALASGEANISTYFAAPAIIQVDAGDPGRHPGRGAYRLL